MDQLITYQAVAAWRSRINRQQEGEIVLVDLIDAQDTGELADYPGLVVRFEIKARLIIITPLPDHAFTGVHPEITGQPCRYSAHSHAVSMHSFDGFHHHPATVGGILTQKRRLSVEVVMIRQTVMDANSHCQKDGAIQVQIDRNAFGQTKLIPR